MVLPVHSLRQKASSFFDKSENVMQGNRICAGLVELSSEGMREQLECSAVLGTNLESVGTSSREIVRFAHCNTVSILGL